MADAAVTKSVAFVQSLQPHLVSLKKYETSFSPDARQLLEAAMKACDNFHSAAESLSREGPGLSGYLLSGAKHEELQQGLVNVQQSLSALLAGTVPLPRSAKEELSNLRTEINTLKIEVPTEQTQVASQMRKLLAEVTDQSKDHDVDLIEANLDEAVRQALQNIYGKTSLDDEELKVELAYLEECIETCRSNGKATDAAIVSLALNSMQRLHASQLHLDESEEEEEEEEEAAEDEDDDDDPFFMPLPSALKMADASKFSDLAKPLGPAKAEPFLIALEPEESGAGMISPTSAGAGGGRASGTGEEETESPGLTAADFEPVPDNVQRKVEGEGLGAAAAAAGLAAGATVRAAAAATATGAPEAADEVVSNAAPRLDTEVSSTAANGETPPPTPGSMQEEEAPAPAALPPAIRDAAAAGKALSVDVTTANRAAGVASPGEEKLSQFVNFLQGDNPGACMFHAQMRLSVEGCKKLANFLRTSLRVRALSLSHNYLGDEGIALICEGLRSNKSVTALDLPDNNISDKGVAILAKSIAHNPSLTQLQLAYNCISDSGAEALAELIRKSSSLKKLGLSFNNIGKTGCQALTSAIGANQSLKQLQLLPGNPVEEKDAKALAKALKHNKKFSIRSFLGME